MLDFDLLPRATPHRLTRAEYDRLIALGFFQGKRVELIHGILVEMSPIGYAHRVVVDRLMELLVPRLMNRARVSIQQPYAAAGASEPEPDVTVFPISAAADYHPARAYLVIEVADSSLEYDRLTKSRLYAASAVDEYWIVNLVQQVVEVYREPAGGEYTSITPMKAGETIAPGAFPDIQIQVDELLR